MCKAIEDLKQRERQAERIEAAKVLLNVLSPEIIAQKLKLPLETVLGLK